MAVAIRTSARGMFKSCRKRWYYQTPKPMGLHLEYTPGIPALDFGVAIHDALEEYYAPEIWGDHIRQQEFSITAFLDSWGKQVKRVKDAEKWDVEIEKQFDDQREMGLSMLRHYFEWAPKADLGWTPLHSEVGFEVPIPVPEDMLDMVKRNMRFEVKGDDNHLYWLNSEQGDWEQVVYQGRIDLILQQDIDEALWILDHKTAAQFGDMPHLEMDQQCGSYMWGLKQLGIQTEGVIYSELKKTKVKEPQILQSGQLSKNKNQGTSALMYRAKLQEMGLSEEGYQDILAKLSEKEFFRRFQVHRNNAELDILHKNIVAEAMDMLDNPFIYPNPSKFNCRGCPFRTPCLSSQDGSDEEYQLYQSGFYRESPKEN